MVKFKKPTKLVVIIGGIVLFALCVIIGLLVWSGSAAKKSTTSKDGTTPDFSAVLPKEKSIDSLGGWKERTSPGGDTYFEFTDTVDSVAISVSQQALPESFKNNLDSKVAEAAKAYNATRTFDANGVKVYAGTKVNGPQSIIFTKNDALVFVIAQKEIQDNAWITYIDSLK